MEDAAQSDRSSSIFGSAKPVDTAAKEREIEERLLRQHDFDAQKVEQEKETRYRYGGAVGLVGMTIHHFLVFTSVGLVVSVTLCFTDIHVYSRLTCR